MFSVKFYITSEHRWYIDLPDYIHAGGNKEDLEMVEGADTMLDLLAQNEREITLFISDKPFENYHFKLSDPIIKSEGMTYISNSPLYDQQEVWLCNVTKFLFNDKFPETIYIR